MKRLVVLVTLGLTVLTLLGGQLAPISAHSGAAVTAIRLWSGLHSGYYVDVTADVPHITRTPGGYDTPGVPDNDLTSIEIPWGGKAAVYELPNYGGICEEFTRDDPNLADNPIGNDRASSLRVGQACPPQVTLYDTAGYGGDYRTFSSAIADLSTTGFDNRASSIHVTRGTRVAVYELPNYGGSCEVFTADDASLIDNRSSIDRISSLRVGVGCPVTLYDAITYGGTNRVVTDDVAHLGNIGLNDVVTSLRVPWGAKVAVYELPNYMGLCEVFTGDDPDLRNNPIGNDRISSLRLGEDCQVQVADGENYGGTTRLITTDWSDLRSLTIAIQDAVSSIRVPAGMKVAVYSDINYGGICEVFTASDPDLRDNPIGTNRISSIRIGADCPAQVVLYEHINYGGAFWIMPPWPGRYPDMSAFGWDNRASSIHVTGHLGMSVDVWDLPNFDRLDDDFYPRPCGRFTADDPDLRDNLIGNDSISSVNYEPRLGDPGCGWYPNQ